MASAPADPEPREAEPGLLRSPPLVARARLRLPGLGDGGLRRALTDRIKGVEPLARRLPRALGHLPRTILAPGMLPRPPLFWWPPPAGHGGPSGSLSSAEAPPSPPALRPASSPAARGSTGSLRASGVASLRRSPAPLGGAVASGSFYASAPVAAARRHRVAGVGDPVVRRRLSGAPSRSPSPKRGRPTARPASPRRPVSNRRSASPRVSTPGGAASLVEEAPGVPLSSVSPAVTPGTSPSSARAPRQAPGTSPVPSHSVVHNPLPAARRRPLPNAASLPPGRLQRSQPRSLHRALRPPAALGLAGPPGAPASPGTLLRFLTTATPAPAAPRIPTPASTAPTTPTTRPAGSGSHRARQGPAPLLASSPVDGTGTTRLRQTAPSAKPTGSPTSSARGSRPPGAAGANLPARTAPAGTLQRLLTTATPVPARPATPASAVPTTPTTRGPASAGPHDARRDPPPLPAGSPVDRATRSSLPGTGPRVGPSRLPTSPAPSHQPRPRPTGAASLPRHGPVLPRFWVQNPVVRRHPWLSPASPTPGRLQRSQSFRSPGSRPPAAAALADLAATAARGGILRRSLTTVPADPATRAATPVSAVRTTPTANRPASARLHPVRGGPAPFRGPTAVDTAARSPLPGSGPRVTARSSSPSRASVHQACSVPAFWPQGTGGSHGRLGPDVGTGGGSAFRGPVPDKVHGARRRWTPLPAPSFVEGADHRWSPGTAGVTPDSQGVQGQPVVRRRSPAPDRAQPRAPSTGGLGQAPPPLPLVGPSKLPLGTRRAPTVPPAPATAAPGGHSLLRSFSPVRPMGSSGHPPVRRQTLRAPGGPARVIGASPEHDSPSLFGVGGDAPVRRNRRLDRRMPGIQPRTSAPPPRSWTPGRRHQASSPGSSRHRRPPPPAPAPTAATPSSAASAVAKVAVATLPVGGAMALAGTLQRSLAAVATPTPTSPTSPAGPRGSKSTGLAAPAVHAPPHPGAVPPAVQRRGGGSAPQSWSAERPPVTLMPGSVGDPAEPTTTSSVTQATSRPAESNDLGHLVDRVVEALEDRVLEELERRGGRFLGAF